MSARIILDYSKLPDAGLVSKSHGMVTALTGNPKFPLPWSTEFRTLAELTAKQEEFSLAVDAAADRDKASVAAKNRIRAELEAIIRSVGRYLQEKSGGDRETLETTGYDLAKEREANPDIPAAPENFKVIGGQGPGTIIASAKAPDGAISFELQATTTPENPASYKTIAQTPGCRKIEVSGLERGKDTTFRLRALGKKGLGPWSDVAVYMPN